MHKEEDSVDSVPVDTTREVTDPKDSIRTFTEREHLLEVTSLPTAENGEQLNTGLGSTY